MANQTMTLDIPSAVFTRLQKRAEQAKRSVEDETLDLLAATVSTDDLQQTLASLPLLDDTSIERAARSGLAAEISSELESLHLKQQREGLTDAESRRSAELVRAYERAMLLRATAAVVMKQRGLDVSQLIAQP